MSIYIKGMKIPKVGVYTCELDVLDENIAVLTICTPIEEPQRSYKLTTIPEGHGRLIDCDSLEREECSGCVNRNHKYIDCMDCAIANAPTIVPAEK